MADEILRYDLDLSLIGDRVATSGWPRLKDVRLVNADASGITLFADGQVAYGPAHTKVSVVINGQEIASQAVVLDDDYLVGEGPIVGVIEPRRVVLDDFLSLAQAPTDEAILAYAKDHGMLGLAPADRGLGRDVVYPNVPWVGEQIAPTIGYSHAPDVTREPLGLWRRVIAEVAAAYSLAASLRLDKLTKNRAWDPLAGILGLPLSPDTIVDPSTPPQLPEAQAFGVPFLLVDATTIDGQRSALAAVLRAWLALGAVRPVITWGGPMAGDPAISLGTSTLFGGLVFELLLAVSGTAGIAICTGCGLPFTPRRRPRPGRFGVAPATYCPQCTAPSADRKTSASQLAAARAWRQRNPGYSRRRRGSANE